MHLSHNIIEVKGSLIRPKVRVKSEHDKDEENMGWNGEEY